MDVIGNPAVVLDNSSAVDDAIPADRRAGVDDCSGHDDCAGPDRCGGGYNRHAVNESGRLKAVCRDKMEKFPSCAVVADGDDKCTSRETMELVRTTDQRTAAKAKPGSAAIIVQKQDGAEAACAASHIQNHFAVPAGSPNQEWITQAIQPGSCRPGIRVWCRVPPD